MLSRQRRQAASVPATFNRTRPSLLGTAPLLGTPAPAGCRITTLDYDLPLSRVKLTHSLLRHCGRPVSLSTDAKSLPIQRSALVFSSQLPSLTPVVAVSAASKCRRKEPARGLFLLRAGSRSLNHPSSKFGLHRAGNRAVEIEQAERELIDRPAHGPAVLPRGAAGGPDHRR